MTHLPPDLMHLGDDLERAAHGDVRRRRRHARRTVPAVLAPLVVLPGVAAAAVALISEDEVAVSLPAGSWWLAGTDPSCTVIVQDVEYRCTVARAPGDEIADWTNTVMPTVDASKHVNGGCRSLDADGIEWHCDPGDAAVREEIIGPDLLGELMPTPSVG